MYVYQEYYGAIQVALIYPGIEFNIKSGKFFDPKISQELSKQCNVISIPVEKDIKQWQKKIYEDLKFFLTLSIE
jgi:hypothetical protein